MRGCFFLKRAVAPCLARRNLRHGSQVSHVLAAAPAAQAARRRAVTLPLHAVPCYKRDKIAILSCGLGVRGSSEVKTRDGRCVEKPRSAVEAFSSSRTKKMPPLTEVAFATHHPSPGKGLGWTTGWKPVPREMPPLTESWFFPRKSGCRARGVSGPRAGSPCHER